MLLEDESYDDDDHDDDHADDHNDDHDGEHIGAGHDVDNKNVSERVLKGRPGVQEWQGGSEQV